MGLTPSERAKQWREKRAVELESIPKVPCACGCGTMITPIKPNGQKVRYVRGHSPNRTEGKPAHNRIGDKPLTSAERQKRYRQRRQKEIDSLSKIPCACGCGTMIAPIGKLGKPVQYALGHNPSGLETRFTKGYQGGTPFPGGDKHPYWNGGVSMLPYGPEFTRSFKRLIRKRDNFTCQSCGITQDEYRRILHKALDIHHIDHDRFNNDPTNLVTVCNRCNIWYSQHRDEPFIVMGKPKQYT